MPIGGTGGLGRRRQPTPQPNRKAHDTAAVEGTLSPPWGSREGSTETAAAPQAVRDEYRARPGVEALLLDEAKPEALATGQVSLRNVRLAYS